MRFDSISSRKQLSAVTLDDCRFFYTIEAVYLLPKAISPQISRRMVICGVYASMTTTEIMLSTFTKRVQDNIGTALFREYLRCMFERVPAMLETLIRDDAELTDILKTSSEVLCDIISEYASDKNIPSYIRPMSLESDYFSPKETGFQAIKTITTAWRTSPSSFSINKKLNECRRTTAI